MGQALPGGVLDAPTLSRPRSLDLRPELPVDREVVGVRIEAPNLDHANNVYDLAFCTPFLFPTSSKASKRRNACGSKTKLAF
jgi:hypothetical protein